VRKRVLQANTAVGMTLSLCSDWDALKHAPTRPPRSRTRAKLRPARHPQGSHTPTTERAVGLRDGVYRTYGARDSFASRSQRSRTGLTCVAPLALGKVDEIAANNGTRAKSPFFARACVSRRLRAPLPRLKVRGFHPLDRNRFFRG